mmetsp:Transcript_37159/g.83507  ORF Transcript_37159/g.83507 Transcript_37159/m.83507 type:complete len:383 (-) Transcript_37159:1208-2356(-)
MVHSLRQADLREGGRGAVRGGRRGRPGRQERRRGLLGDEHRQGGHRRQRHDRHVPSQEHRGAVRGSLEEGHGEQVQQRAGEDDRGGAAQAADGADPARGGGERRQLAGRRDSGRTRRPDRPREPSRRDPRRARDQLHGVLPVEGHVHPPHLLHRDGRRRHRRERHAGSQRHLRLGEGPRRLRREHVRVPRRESRPGRRGRRTGVRGLPSRDAEPQRELQRLGRPEPVRRGGVGRRVDGAALRPRVLDEGRQVPRHAAGRVVRGRQPRRERGQRRGQDGGQLRRPGGVPGGPPVRHQLRQRHGPRLGGGHGERRGRAEPRRELRRRDVERVRLHLHADAGQLRPDERRQVPRGAGRGDHARVPRPGLRSERPLPRPVRGPRHT